MSETPRTERIMDNFHIATVADTREQSIAHREEAQREIENLECELAQAEAMIGVFKMQNDELGEQLAAARAELAKAHRRIHGDESEDCVFCNSKRRTPVATGNQECPQCYLCTLEAEGVSNFEALQTARAELAALRAEQAKPLDRPDKPGYWWRWCDIFKKWEGPLWISLPAQTSLGEWLPAAPPRDLREGGE